MDKRKDGTTHAGGPLKRLRPAHELSVAVVNTSVAAGPLIQAVPRTSGLQAPIIQLSGHAGEVYACRFDESGQVIASASQDRTILLWNTYGANENFGVLKGHKNAVLDVAFSRDSRTLYSASADATLGAWDVDTGARIRTHTGHVGVINALDRVRRGPELLLSGGDDGTLGLWDPRVKVAVDYFETDFPVLGVAFGELGGSQVFSAGIDPEIKVWDTRQRDRVLYTLPGHTDSVTSLAVSSDMQFLLSRGMDGTVRSWDVRAFAPEDRSIAIYEGAPANAAEQGLIRADFSPDGTRVVSGAADRTVVVWDTAAPGKIVYKLPGHAGSVNDARLSPSEGNVLVSASVDRTLLLGELGV
ncbi:WD40-repeat-containing domain protein [Limtongia smithiae]|uniref:WD40-repeat-containing domain protein n=1 Tax=Limtongia smithiae TaxID=1125753 RepID=UPI0034CD1AEA